MKTIKETKKEWESIMIDNIIDEHYDTDCYTNSQFQELLNVIRTFNADSFTISIMEDSLLSSADREQNLKYLHILDKVSYLLKLSNFELLTLSDKIADVLTEVNEKVELVRTNLLIK